MREAQKLQQGQAAQPQSRPPPRHKQPPRVRTQGCDRQEKGPEQRHARSGQVPRRGQSGAWGNERNRCGNVSSGGGNWTPPQQPCSRPHHKTGRVRLPGGQGLDDTCQPGRRRAKARWVRGARSFGSLQFDGDQFSKAPIVDALEPSPRGSVNRTNPISRRYRAAPAHCLRRFVPDTDVGGEVSNGWP